MAIYGFGLAGVMLSVAASNSGSTAFAWVLVPLFVAMGAWGLVSCVVKIEPTKVRIRTSIRTRSISFDDLTSAEVVTRMIGLYQRVCVRLHFHGGGHLDVTSVNEAKSRPDLIEEMATVINAHITQGRV